MSEPQLNQHQFKVVDKLSEYERRRLNEIRKSEVISESDAHWLLLMVMCLAPEAPQ